MFNRIVVGVDGTDGGRDAIALAQMLAGPHSEIVLVSAYAYEQMPGHAAPGRYAEELLAKAQGMLETAAEADPRCRGHVVNDGSPARALQEAATQEHADLIVVGSAHRGSLGRVLIGDVSRGTLHGAPCPVAVAPHGFREHATAGLRTIGVGANGTPESDAAVAVAQQIAVDAGATLRLFTALPTPATMGLTYGYAVNWPEVLEQRRRNAETNLQAKAAQLDIPVEIEAADGEPGPALEGLSERVDLVVAGSRGWGTLRSVVLGSATDRLVHHAHCPVLVVPSPA